MEYRQVGRSGLTVSTMGLGCNNFGARLNEDDTAKVVHAALDEGVTFFDTAAMYGDGLSEAYLGSALGARRGEAVIATKFGAHRRPGADQATGSRSGIIRECEASLSRLGTDHIDLYYQHYPDKHTPIEETLAALDHLVRDGKVRYIANSNVNGWQIADADHLAARGTTGRFIASQFEWNLLKRGAEDEIVPACRRFGLGMIPFFPLASGLLTGKYSAGEPFPVGSRMAGSAYFAKDATEKNFATVDRLRAIADEHRHTLLELAVGWLLAQDGVPSVISGATSAEQVRQGSAAAARTLSGEAVDAVTAATEL
ncbi:aldo/keto reductase [Tomitella cavernea]|uniref:Aldo/keto reductase n=1 Tax=Tomitella cavernea TaxID=1387982 RepID=A0ABP9C3H3_9ACTN|nr:aldo/keto reductase [Tomitella cavernea]